MDKADQSSLHNLLQFVEFTHKYRKVIRQILATGENRNENDLEHSSQLALVAWYLNQSEKYGFNEEKLIKYSLAHDLVEVYAGDTFFHTSDVALQNSKEKREKSAANRIAQEFPQFKELHKIIQDYESKKDKEAVFIYALDKIIPVLNIYLDGGKSWKRDTVTYEMIRTKDEKVATSKELTILWKEFVTLLEEKKSKLFPRTDK